MTALRPDLFGVASALDPVFVAAHEARPRSAGSRRL